MIQDIFPHKLNNQYDPGIVAEDGDRVFIFRANQVYAGTDKLIEFPKVSEITLPDGKSRESAFTYLFSIDEERYFRFDTDVPEEVVSVDYKMQDLKELREAHTEPGYRIFAAYTAKHICDWYRDTKFCGKCGGGMVHSKVERAMTCSVCHYTAYPRIMPAVIVGVINGERILLTKYRRGYNHNALIAGFTEIGETVEQTVEREVMEEAGVRVKNIRYYGSQPWGIANDILLGYYCDVDGDDTITMDDNELKSAEWTRREDIVLQPDESSLTNEMMRNFKEGKLV